MAVFIFKSGSQTGPFDDKQIFEGLQLGVYSADDLAWRQGMANWRPLWELYPQLKTVSASSSPSPQAVPNAGQFTKPAGPQRLSDDAGMRILLPVGRSGWAIAAGYLGLFSALMLPAPIAIVVSIIAIFDIRKSEKTNQPKYGMGRAIFGLCMGLLGTAIGALWFF